MAVVVIPAVVVVVALGVVVVVVPVLVSDDVVIGAIVILVVALVIDLGPVVGQNYQIDMVVHFDHKVDMAFVTIDHFVLARGTVQKSKLLAQNNSQEKKTCF